MSDKFNRSTDLLIQNPPNVYNILQKYFVWCHENSVYNTLRFQYCTPYYIILTVFRTSSSDKLTGLPHLRITVNKPHLFPALQSVWEELHSESSQAVKQDMSFLQTDRTSDLQNGDHGIDNVLLRHVDKIISINQSRARKVSAGKPLLPKHGNKPGLAPGSLASRNTREGFTTDTGRLLINTSILSNSLNPKATCHPKFHIVFLKTHKTASSTILNILYRFGESRNLTFALPLKKHSQLFYPFPFASYFVEGFSSRSIREFHIMCNHMRFRKSEVSFIYKINLSCVVLEDLYHGLHVHSI